MQNEFEMSMIGELTFVLDLQVKQCKYGILINQAKYIKEMQKKFGFKNVREIDTFMSPITKLDKNEKEKDVNQKLVDLILCFAYAYVLDFKHVLRNPI